MDTIIRLHSFSFERWVLPGPPGFRTTSLRVVTPFPAQYPHTHGLTFSHRGLEPGGYLELQDFCLPYTSDDSSLTPDNPLHRSSSLSVEAAKLSGRPIDLAPQYKTYLENAGFVDVVERRLKWPLNEWPKDPHYKELGSWVRECHDQGSEGMIMALFTRYLGWTKEEVMVLCAQIRAQLKDRSVHGYIPM